MTKGQKSKTWHNIVKVCARTAVLRLCDIYFITSIAGTAKNEIIVTIIAKLIIITTAQIIYLIFHLLK